MTMRLTEHFNLKSTPQSEPVPTKNMVKNNAGGYVFDASKWTQFDRFLILGSEGGTYYCSEKKMTVDNANNVIECIKADGIEAVKRIHLVSVGGKAPKNDPAIFALALCCTFGDQETKNYAYGKIASVCRTGTHIFQFCENIQALRGWSRGLRKGVSDFYVDRGSDQIAYQMVKYQQRNGWTHKDVLRLAHPKTDDPGMDNLFRYAVGKWTTPPSPVVQKYLSSVTHLDPIIIASEDIKKADLKKAVQLITEYNLPREVVPTHLLNEKRVWEALLQKMPLTALIRNLGKMTEVGLLTSSFDDAVKKVDELLSSTEALKKARIHPLNVLLALKVYGMGRGMKGSLTWKPVQKVLNRLEQAFYDSFSFVTPTNKNWLLGLDISGSTESMIAGYPISVKEAEAVLAMATARIEPNHEFLSFDHGIKRVNISKNDSLNSVMNKLSGWSGGGTDCSLPIVYATQANLPIDVFWIGTDNETWCGGIHPYQALQNYRKKTGRNAKMIVCGMTSTGFSIADPSDPGMLDVVGFSSDLPEVMRSFVMN